MQDENKPEAEAPAVTDQEVDVTIEENSEQQHDASQQDVNVDASEEENKEESSEQDAEASGHKKNRISRKDRIGQLTRQKHEANNRADEAEKKLKEANARLKAYSEIKPPNIDDFTSEQEFETAQRRHDVAERRRIDAEMDKEEAQRVIQDTQAELGLEREAVWSARARVFSETAKDFDQVVSVIGTGLDEDKAALIKGIENGPAVAYAIASNPEHASEFIHATPLQAARLIGRVESALRQKPGKKISKAPPPVQTVAGSSGSGSPDYDRMSMAEYEKARGFT